MPSVCRECREDLEHCHGAVIHHALSTMECTEDCGAPDAVHAFRLDCEAVGCACAVTGTAVKVS